MDVADRGRGLSLAMQAIVAGATQGKSRMIKTIVAVFAVLFVGLLLLAIFGPQWIECGLDLLFGKSEDRLKDRHEFEHRDARLEIEAKALNEAATRAKYPESARIRDMQEPRGM
jgi:hypothetical protein